VRHRPEGDRFHPASSRKAGHIDVMLTLKKPALGEAKKKRQGEA